LCAAQQGDAAASGWRGVNQSLVHSQALPHTSYPFGAKLRTGEVPSYRSSLRFCHGNSPCQVFAAGFPALLRDAAMAAPLGFMASLAPLVVLVAVVPCQCVRWLREIVASR
jgi:hypothetical protein